MIGKLKGVVDEVNENYLLIDVMGVCYQVYCSSKLTSTLSPGSSAEIVIETHVREDQITLFGFSSKREKEAYLKLITVKGVGPKMAMNIIGALDVIKLTNAIASGDKDIFSAISGVGPKLASRIISELKDKSLVILDNFTSDGKAHAKKGEGDDLVDNAVQALQNLGVSRYDAYLAASKMMSENQGITLSELIKLSLKQISK